MIIIQLMGGLGNQLFQFATAYQVASDHQTDLFLDIHWFRNQTKRAYQLDHYPISQCFASIFTIKKFEDSFSGKAWRTIHKTLWRDASEEKYHIVSEQSADYEPNQLKQPGNIYMRGYFQNEKYFLRVADEIQNLFIPINKLDQKNNEILDLINQSQSVSLHIRRGDYINDPATQRVHGTCSTEYYAQAIECISQKVAEAHFFIFSDDPDWAEKCLDIGYPKMIMRHNDANHAVDDLWLMSHCKHHIIANSSFSWWGAWLCKNPGKLVVAPQKWFADPSRTSIDILPETWMQI